MQAIWAALAHFESREYPQRVLRFQVFFRMLSLWALLLTPELASARTLVQAETRVGVFEVAAEVCIRVSGLPKALQGGEATTLVYFGVRNGEPSPR